MRGQLGARSLPKSLCIIQETNEFVLSSGLIVWTHFGNREKVLQMKIAARNSAVSQSGDFRAWVWGVWRHRVDIWVYLSQ